MAFLLAGLALGSAIALTTAERDMYYTTRSSYSFVGKRNGMDVYRDRVTGVFYVDDGWDVQKIGVPGWNVNPVDAERLRKIFEKHAPQEIPWIEFTLAMYAGKETELWKRLYFRFERPQKPKKPTAIFSDSLSRKVRKDRWEEYDQEIKDYEVERSEADAKFRKECQYWDNRRKESQSQTTVLYAQSGKVLLQRAFSSSNVKVPCKVPLGRKGGDSMLVTYLGQDYYVTIPQGVVAGQEFDVLIPILQPVNQSIYETNVQPTASTVPRAPPTPMREEREKTVSGVHATIPPPAIGKEGSNSSSNGTSGQLQSHAEEPVPVAIAGEVGKATSLPRVDSFEFLRK